MSGVTKRTHRRWLVIGALVATAACASTATGYNQGGAMGYLLVGTG